MSWFCEIDSYPENGGTTFSVYLWSRFRDSGYCVGVFGDRQEAIRRARAFCAVEGHELRTCEIVLFEGRDDAGI